ncbi:MAG: rhodanese-like domain-containing protein [Elusimicrobia bacterium]|nr:rhodanese-like domain-containing protein [Elusimicrobiota bacterium]
MTHATRLKELTKEELKQKIEGKEPFELVNVLSPEFYRLGVIKGSKKIPLSQLAGRFKELDKSKEVVTYCANPACDASHKAGELLSSKGFKVAVYKGGAEEWAAAGLPVEKAVDLPSERKPEPAGDADATGEQR